MNRFLNITLAGVLAVVTGLTGCGGGSGGGTSLSGGIGGTGKIASGRITGFGSIFVNGVEYDTSSSSISVDDSTASESDLRIGMVVTVDGTVSGTIGVASSVSYDNDIEGPVSGSIIETDGISKRFTVLGITVVVESSGTIFDSSVPGFSYETLALDDVVQISGYYDGAGLLHASYIRKEGVFPGNSSVELKGTASVAGAGAGAGDSFTINSITVTIAAGADLSDVPGAQVTDGMLVEVHGTLSGGAAITATRIQQEDASLGNDGDSVSLEGLVSGFTGDLSSFMVAGQPVNAVSATFEPATLQLVDGMKIEVEGSLAAGVLVVSEVESRGGDTRVHARVNLVTVTNTSLNEGSIRLLAGDGTILVTSNSTTSFEDDTGADTSPPFRLNEINSGDFLEINAYSDGSGIVASEVHRRAADDVIVQGKVEQNSGSTITLLGVSFFTDGGTQYEDGNDAPLAGGAATFFGIDRAGDLVKIKDNQPGDGTADEVDLED